MMGYENGQKVPKSTISGMGYNSGSNVKKTAGNSHQRKTMPDSFIWPITGSQRSGLHLLFS